LSFQTSEAQVQALFSRVGPVNRVIMGLNSKTKTPCGFCFVEYFNASAALEAVAMLSGTVLDARTIRIELDFGFKNGRHFGRGATGGQVV
jgi:nuclear cap-binding protein subunit 2